MDISGTRAGKRWRPFLTVATYQALRDDRGEPMPDDIQKITPARAAGMDARRAHRAAGFEAAEEQKNS